VRFENAYTFPTCSPARAALLTGRYPSRYGLGNAIDSSEEPWSLPLSEVTIPEMLDQGSPHGYTSALIGKWHLASFTYSHPELHALDQGFDWHQGSLENLGQGLTTSGRKRTYFDWERNTNGKLEYVTEYATTVTVDDALRQMQRLPEPWFMTVAFNAPHVPIHLPPPELHGYDEQGLTSCNPFRWLCYNAMVESVDTEIGRLIDTMDPGLASRTTIILTSDNGTPEHGIRPPFDPARDKGTVYDGGVRVPLVVTGPLVAAPGSVAEGFVSLMDVYATVADIAEVDLTQIRARPTSPDPVDIDAVSFVDLIVDPTLPGRDRVVSELFMPNAQPPWNIQERMVRENNYKLRRRNGVDELFHYGAVSLDEGPDLISAGPLSPQDQAAYDALVVELEGFVNTTDYQGP
jgi:arylsulfatase A-like enzyme